MAAYTRGDEYLCGEELEEYLESLLIDEESEVEEVEENIIGDEQSTYCTCGKVATSVRAACNLLHFTCGDTDMTDSSGTAVDDSEICSCCSMAIGKIYINFSLHEKS